MASYAPAGGVLLVIGGTAAIVTQDLLLIALVALLALLAFVAGVAVCHGGLGNERQGV